MPHFNSVTLVGHATRDVETRSFASGGMVANFGIAVNSRAKENGEWVDKPMFIDCKAFQGSNGGKLAEICRDYIKKGSAILVAGRLELEQWDDKNGGGKRSKHVVIVDTMQLLSAKGERQAQEQRPAATAAAAAPVQDDAGEIPF